MSPTAVAPEVEAAIRAALDDYAESALAADWDRYLETFDADPLCMPAGAPAMASRDAIRSFYSAFPPLDLLSLTPDTFETAGELVLELGRYEFRSGDIHDRGKYLHVWRRRADGEWKLYRNIANSDGDED